MSATWLSHLVKVGSILVSALLVSGTPQVNNEQILFDRGLPSEHINIEPDIERSNLRWRGGYRNESFYGDDFSLGKLGERYVVDHVRTWAVLGYREEGPASPEEVGDWFSRIRLLGGEASEEPLAVRALGELDVGSSLPSNPNVTITQVTYPNDRNSEYFNFGPTVPVLQIDFHNLNWLVEGGRRYNFSVQGVGRQFLDTEYSHAWYNHASNAALSGTLQQGADNLMSAFSDTGEFLRIIDGEENWNKATDLNIQIFGRAVENVAVMPDENRNTALVEVADNLNQVGLLTNESYNRALREIEQGIITVMSQLVSKLIEQDGYYTSTLLIVEPETGNLSEEWKYIFEQRDRELEQLNATGILTVSVYEYLRSEVASGRIFHKLQLYQTAQMQLEREESVDPDLVTPRLDKLRAAEIISESGYTSLLEALEASELQSPIEFLSYFERAQVFDLASYSLEPEIYFPDIYQSVAQMLSQTGIVSDEISEFDLKLELDQIYEFDREDTPDVEEEWRTYNAVVSAQVGDRTYEQSSYYSPPNDEQDFLGRISSDGLADIFNKVLQDQSSPYRLFPIVSFIPQVDYAQFGIIALTQAQADAYWEGNWHATDYEGVFTSDRIAEVITLLKDIELLKHLTTDEISAGEKRIARQYITEPYQLFSAFKDMVLLFDWESAEGETPYKYMLKSLSDISRGSFEPVNIDDHFDWENQTAGLAFTLNGTRYSTDLDFDRDWLDPHFFEFIESVVAKEELTGQFYSLSEGEYGVDGYIFLEEDQLERLRSQQLVNISTE